GPVLVGHDLDGGQGYRHPVVSGVHLVAVHDAMVGHDVVVHGVVAVAGAVGGHAAEPLVPADPEVQLVAGAVGLEVRVVHPDLLRGRVGPGAEHLGRLGWVPALADERGVVDGAIGHFCFSSGGSDGLPPASDR